MRSLIFICLAAATLVPGKVRAQDNDLSLVINPQTGAASIRNDTSAAVNIDGYLLTSGLSVFSPLSWSTLTSNPSYPGWAQGPAAPNRLGEANLLSSLAVGGGASIGLGTPYVPFTPTQIGQPEPALTFEYHVAGGNSFVGDVVFAPQNNIVMIIDPTTGTASLQNQSNFSVNIDGLLITSPAHVLNPTGWNGFAESGMAGWTMGVAATNRLAEGNLLDSTLLAANGAPLSIGSPINPAMIDDETDLVVEFHIAGGESVTGGVVFAAASVSPVVGGDYNGDGTVNAADYAVWRNFLGQTFTLPGEKPGAVTPGVVDAEDYSYWRSRFGATSGGGGGLGGSGSIAAIAVPEPSSALLGCVWGLIVLVGHRQLRGWR